MKVSVIVPLYNKAAHIQRCLDSIARQTFRDFEAIIIDDGSTDGSGELARSFGDGRFRMVSQSNAGPGAARNRGALEARAEILAFLDADDEWLPEYLENNLAALDSADPEVAAASCGYLESGVDLRELWESRGLRPGVFKTAPSTSPALLIAAVAFMSPWNTVIRREVFVSLGGFYARKRALFAEDAWLMVQILLRHPVLIRFEPPLVLFNRDASELSANLPGKRPIEPFLLEPEPLIGSCPQPMQPLLRQFLAIRALKTACVLGFWGDWRTARALRERFSAARDFRLPYFWRALFCSTPAAPLLGACLRALPREVAMTDTALARRTLSAKTADSDVRR